MSALAHAHEGRDSVTVEALIPSRVIGIEWRDVPGAPRYQVSSYGVVRKSINKTHPERRQVMFIKPEIDKDGYKRVHIWKYRWLVHRLVYATFCGELLDGLVVCHRDGDRDNNTPANLLQATQRINISHKRRHGTWQEGEGHPRALHDNDTVKRVAKSVFSAPRSRTGRLKRGVASVISEEHGVDLHLVYSISRTRSDWSCVTDAMGQK